MRSIFDPDGTLMTILRKFSDIVLCNLLFCLLCCGIITVGAALTGLHAAMQAVAADTTDDIHGNSAMRILLRTFRSDFLPSTGLWLIVAGIAAFLYYYHYIVWSLTGPLGSSYRVMFFVLLLVFLFGFQYFFPIRARFVLNIRQTLRNSWLLSAAALPWTLLTIAISGGAVYISFFLNPDNSYVALFLWLACGFALITYLESFCFIKAFQKLGVDLLQRDMDTGKPAEGAVFIDEAHRKDDLMVQESTFSNPDWNRKVDPEEEEREKQHQRDTQGKKKHR